MRLFICSNSGPAPQRDPTEPLRPGASGGLVPHLVALLDIHGGEWFFATNGPKTTRWPPQAGRVGLHPVTLTQRQHEQHYETVSVQTLLWLFHYLHETSVGPTFDAGLHAAWAGYRAVNDGFADRVAGTCAEADGPDVMLVTDYHLLLVPAALARRRLPAKTKVVYAHQVPWCEPDYFAILPAAIRAEILGSLVSCDVVVFHSSRWLDAFARCCARYLPGATVRDTAVEYRDHTTDLTAVPFPLDTAAVLDIAGAEATERWRQRLHEQARGRRLLVRVDRLDLWKNHPRGLAAFEELLARHRRLADDVWFLCVLAPTRARSTRHRAYESACREAAERINESVAAPGRPEPVTLLYPEDRNEVRHRAVAALSQASTVLINPTYDGFNLVAKEAALVADDAAILLSRTAGAYEPLAHAVLPLDPCDVTGTADALHAALVDGRRPDPAGREAARDGVRSDDAGAWLRAALGAGEVPECG